MKPEERNFRRRERERSRTIQKSFDRHRHGIGRCRNAPTADEIDPTESGRIARGRCHCQVSDRSPRRAAVTYTAVLLGPASQHRRPRRPCHTRCIKEAAAAGGPDENRSKKTVPRRETVPNAEQWSVTGCMLVITRPPGFGLMTSVLILEQQKPGWVGYEANDAQSVFISSYLYTNSSRDRWFDFSFFYFYRLRFDFCARL